MSDTPAILTRLDGIRAETLQRLDRLTQAQLDWRPPDGSWSLGEVFMHLAIDD